jgi:hypothetical protein
VEKDLLLLAGLVAVAMFGLALSRGWLGRKDQKTADRVRRGMGNALLGFQEFVEPSVEYIFQAQNVEQKDDEEDDGLGVDEEALRSSLAEAMSRSPIDHEEVRRYLTAARRAGLDWKALFEQAVADELKERPYRAPSMPPGRRVAPRVD